MHDELAERIVRQRCHGARLIRVKSWVPTMGTFGLEWPLLLVEVGGERRTEAPIWPPETARKGV